MCVEEGVLIVDILYVCVRGWGLIFGLGILLVNFYREICWLVDFDYRIYVFRVYVYVFCYFFKVVNLKICL